ncbi:hypothetical protein BD413DRAFT_597644 [Trametes elegans]|nr:hypothetical protein BD413DRAFT_597644 [Trametes elegans]
MFGEQESESPRVPSPWDPFLPSPPSGTPPAAPASLHNGIPKLVPEVEEGNVEYKLKLTNISDARFARLVTQLKWRLLEGGGQAYYELGVADSGALIGLSRADLDESLSTLEMMAGEIGASVIIVKEIEVPPTIAALADRESGYTDPDTGEWTRKMRRRAPGPAFSSAIPSDGDLSTTATETETDFTTDFTDLDDVSSSVSSDRIPGIATPLSFQAFATVRGPNRPVRTNPDRPTAQSSPFIAPLDDDLALFSMEPEPAFRVDDDAPAETDAATISGTIGDDELELGPRHTFAGLEIAAVYKPRPVRHRTPPGALGPTPGRHGKRYPKPKGEKKIQPWHQHLASGPTSGLVLAKGAGKGPKPPAGPQLSKEEKALQRRLARDKKREEKRAALVARAEVDVTCAGEAAEEDVAGFSAAESTPVVVVDATDATLDAAASILAAGAHGLHVLVADTPEAPTSASPEADPAVYVRELTANVEATLSAGVVAEPRLIVEALVVRKMSIEEATLDFGRLLIV